jgi:hypothetical protein
MVLLSGQYNPKIEVSNGPVFGEKVTISRGDVNNDNVIDILDINYLINYHKGEGAEPVPNRLLGDTNCDGNINILDIVLLINYKYKGGAPPGLCFKF